jgi:YidC/Oxa1 family membrane protein insertase
MNPIGFLWDTIVYNPMLNALLFLYSIIPNYGVAIIVFTILIALLTMPFRILAQNSMKKQQQKMAVLKPKLDELKKKYKDNQQALQQAQMKLYQEHGALNPFNPGCLLTLLPFPIFIGLYSVILTVMGDRPDKMLDLAHRIYPPLAHLAGLIPVDSNFLGLSLSLTPQQQGIFITVLMVGLVVGTSWVQTRMMSTQTMALDPSQAQMNQSMQLMTPLIFGFFVLNAPTGLSLYWITFSVMGIVQQYLTSGWGNLFGGASRGAVPASAKKSNGSSASSRQSSDSSAETPASITGTQSGTPQPSTSLASNKPPAATPAGETPSKGKKRGKKKQGNR